MASQTSARGRAGPRAVLGMGFRDALSGPDGPRTHKWTPGPTGGIVEAKNLFLVSFWLQIGLGFWLHWISRPPGGPRGRPGLAQPTPCPGGGSRVAGAGPVARPAARSAKNRTRGGEAKNLWDHRKPSKISVTKKYTRKSRDFFFMKNMFLPH